MAVASFFSDTAGNTPFLTCLPKESELPEDRGARLCCLALTHSARTKLARGIAELMSERQGMVPCACLLLM